MNDIIAHVRHADGTPQYVATHLHETAAIARALAAKLDLPEAGELLGLMHDLGKYLATFQEYIKAATGVNLDVVWKICLQTARKSTTPAQAHNGFIAV